jgi:hypothetical protein
MTNRKCKKNRELFVFFKKNGKLLDFLDMLPAIEERSGNTPFHGEDYEHFHRKKQLWNFFGISLFFSKLLECLA